MKVNQDLVGDSSRHVRRCPPQIQPLILGGLAALSQMHSQPYNECKAKGGTHQPTLGCPARVSSDCIGPVQKSEVFHGELREAPSPSQDTHLHWLSLGEGALSSLWLSSQHHAGFQLPLLEIWLGPASALTNPGTVLVFLLLGMTLG